MSEQSNIATVQTLFAALNNGDLTHAEEEFLHEDVNVHVPGQHALSSKHIGKQNVLDFYRNVRGHTHAVTFEIEAIAATGNKVLVELRLQAHRTGENAASLDVHGMNAITFADGKITEIRQYTHDQHATDAYLSSSGAR